MKLSGLSKLARGREADPGPGSDQDVGISDVPPTDPEAGDNSDDLELEKRWLQLARVDADQFRAFFDKYHDPVFQFLALRTGNDETAQDLTQEVFVYALEHLDRFNWQGYSFGAWLFHIARKRVLPRHWRTGRQASEEKFRRRQPEDGEASDLAESVERNALLARVRSLIARFDDDRHDVFVLHVYMEMSARDTALAMGLPSATVRSHLRRGRVQLAEWLRDDQALTDAERRHLSEELAREQGLSVAPETRRRRAAPGTAGAAKGRGDDEGGDHHD
jgi:RNA polymerase sigma-70 factor (ECF subfamily)